MRGARGWAALACIHLAAGCSPPAAGPPPAPTAPPGLFREIAAAAGVGFVHQSGMLRALHPNLLQTTGSGCAVFDYDGDGWLDLYLVQGQHGDSGGNRLYRSRNGTAFEDVTDRAGVRGAGYGMGCAAGDYDGDGDVDLYVTNYGANILYRNEGDGTFSDVTREAGVAAGGWSTVAAFLDVDADGDLDLYVGRYVHFTEKSRQFCETMGVTGGCNPSEYRAEPDILYINQGGGRFADGTRRAGIVDANGRALGVLVDDYDDDGRPDIFVANDGSADYLFHNEGGGRFREVGVPAGVAFGLGGRALASMGCDFGDYDADGRLDLVVGSFEGEAQGLYRGVGRGLFATSVGEAGMSAATSRALTFGLGFLDYDNDGDLDLAQANGHVHPLIETVDPEAPYRQSRQLFENLGGGRFRDAGADAGADYTAPTVGRGMAFGDIDNDGDIDLLVNNNGLPASLLRNDAAAGRHWLGVTLRHPGGEARVLGARVRVEVGGARWERRARTAYSFAASNDPRVHFGLGSRSGPARVSVRWPGGGETRLEAVPVDRYLEIGPGGLLPVPPRGASGSSQRSPKKPAAATRPG